MQKSKSNVRGRIYLVRLNNSGPKNNIVYTLNKSLPAKGNLKENIFHNNILVPLAQIAQGP